MSQAKITNVDYAKIVTVEVDSVEKICDMVYSDAGVSPILLGGDCECCSSKIMYVVYGIEPILEELEVKAYDATFILFQQKQEG